MVVLTRLMQQPWLAGFRLTGSTALCLQLGHRWQNDITLQAYSKEPIAFDAMESRLRTLFPGVVNIDDGLVAPNNLGLHLFITEGATPLKVDILQRREPFLFSAHEENGICMTSIEEIALTRLSSIANGGRKHHFYDVAGITDQLPLIKLLMLYSKTHPAEGINRVLEGLTNFTHAHHYPDPVSLIGVTWDGVQDLMRKEVERMREYFAA